jgi:hypothetical protein
MAHNLVDRIVTTINNKQNSLPRWSYRPNLTLHKYVADYIVMLQPHGQVDNRKQA